MKAVVAAFNQEKALVGAFSVITNHRMQLFEALVKDENGQDIVCVVCSDKSSGKHYGQFTCEGRDALSHFLHPL